MKIELDWRHHHLLDRKMCWRPFRSHMVRMFKWPRSDLTVRTNTANNVKRWVAVTLSTSVCRCTGSNSVFGWFAISYLQKRTKTTKKKSCLCSVRDCYTRAEAVIRFSTGSSASEAATNNQSHWFPLQQWLCTYLFWLKNKKGLAY